jgi:hypothetical protein
MLSCVAVERRRDALPEETVMPAQGRFAPSRHGFAFTNSWPSEPAVTLASPFGQINVGNAKAGLCGGMVFAAIDHWQAAAVPPAVRPAPGEPLYGYIVRRLIDSWHLPAGVTQYYQWMNLPDGDTGFDLFRRHVVIDRGLAWRTVRVQWPQIRADLGRGTPAALGLVTVASSRPADLALNHQVLAYDYDLSGAEVSVRVYDPNRGQRDDIWIRFDTSTPTKPTTFTHNLGISHPIRGFFRTAYTPSTPPAVSP